MPGISGTQGCGGVKSTSKKSVNGSSVLVLGVAYKRDIDDVRESPALDIIRVLYGTKARTMIWHDPYVQGARKGVEGRARLAHVPEVTTDSFPSRLCSDHD